MPFHLRFSVVVPRNHQIKKRAPVHLLICVQIYNHYGVLIHAEA